MFSDEEDDLFSNKSNDSFNSVGIILEDVKPEEEADSTQPAGAWQPNIEDLTARMTQLKEEDRRLDDLARELKTAITLRKEMERCYSTRIGGGPINCRLENRFLSTGSRLVVLNVENTFIFSLKDWILTVSWNSCNLRPNPPVSKTSSQSIQLRTFDRGQKKSFELFVSHELLPVKNMDPLICIVELTRVFDISGVNACFRVPLSSTVFCSLHMLSLGQPHDKPVRSISSVSIPSSLVNLLSGCPDDVGASHVLRLLLHASSLDSTIDASSTTVALLLSLSRSVQETISVSIRTEPRMFYADITVRDQSVRDLFTRDIKLYLLTLISACRKQPKDSLSCLPECDSLDQLYESAVNVYK